MSPQKMPRVDGKFLDLVDRIRSSYLLIIIWGPAKGQPKYEKRKELKKGLKRAYPKADVFFPEDEALNGHLSKIHPVSKKWNSKQKGDLILEMCDLCIALDSGQGVGEEIARAIDTPHNSKLYIYTDSRYRRKKTYPRDVRKFGNQEYYTNKQYTDCELVTWAIERADEIAFTNIFKH